MLVAHTKACCTVLGDERGLECIALAGYQCVVVYLSPEGDAAQALAIAQGLGLTVVALALPKRHSNDLIRAPEVMRWVHVAAAHGVPPQLILSDRLDEPADPEADRALAEWVDQLPLGARIENNGTASERFSSLIQFTRLLARAKGLRPVIDLGHVAAVNADLRTAARLAETAAAVELHDNDGSRDLHLMLGSGAGKGSFRTGLAALARRPSQVVVETNARAGAAAGAWVSAMRRELSLLEQALDAQFEPVEAAMVP